MLHINILLNVNISFQMELIVLEFKKKKIET